MNLHKHALDQLNLQVGDLVEVIHSIPSLYGGWFNGWASQMDEYIGTQRTVRKVCDGNRGVLLEGQLPFKFPALCLKVVKRASKNDSTDKTLHQVALESMGLEVGDIVKIAHITPSEHGGWCACWTRSMDSTVDMVGEVKEVKSDYIYVYVNGIGSWSYPAHCLELIRKGIKRVHMKLNDEYNAEVFADRVQVGCQTISTDVILEMAKVITELKSKK
jgi:ribosomal protein S17